MKVSARVLNVIVILIIPDTREAEIEDCGLRPVQIKVSQDPT
jgi:hypothetical protein